MNTVFKPIRKETSLLLEWYDANGRQLPWRMPPGSNLMADPYHVWLSEIMLQQTQVTTVKDYYAKFLYLWPTLTEMATTDLEEILKAWAGLGYYSRARNLKKCAEMVVNQYEGAFPTTSLELVKLPGIGPYTSAAIAAIAFGESVSVVDGNVERVISRYYAVSTPFPRAKLQINKLTESLVPTLRSGDFAQAMMDMGALICTPRKPKCDICPWHLDCEARLNTQQGRFPVKPAKKKIPTRRGAAFVAMNCKGEILLHQRKENGMLAGMSEVPTTNWSVNSDGETRSEAAPFSSEWCFVGEVRHIFTHFKLEIKVYFSLVKDCENNDGWWVPREKIMDEALPELMKKIIRLAIATR